jgi:hypothetical protein
MGDGYTDERTDIGTYSISCTGLKSNDYVIRYSKGLLTIVQKAVHFSWDHAFDYEFMYDGKEHGLTAVVSKDDLVGLDKREGEVVIVYEDNNRYPSFAKDVKRNAETWEVESYTAKVQSLKGPRAHNYKIDWTDDEEYNFTWDYRIVPAALTLTPNEVTTIFGEEAVWNGYTAAKLVADEKQDDVVLGKLEYKFVKPDGKTEYAPGSWVGDYKILFVTDKFNTAEGVRAQNYTLSAAEGAMEVIKRGVTLVWSTPKSFEYDGQYHEVKVEKAKNDYAPDSSLVPELIYTDEKKVNAGSYQAIAKLSAKTGEEGQEGASYDALNYEILGNSDHYAWQITKRPATIYAKPNKILYKDAPKANGFYIDKKPLVKNVEKGTLDKIGDVTYKFTYKKNGKPGNYSIIPVVRNLNPNYYIAGTVNGALTVNHRVTELLVQGKAVGKNKIRLNWNVVTGAAKYKVYFCKCSSNGVKRAPKFYATVSKTSILMKGLKKNTCYKFYVKAYDANGNLINKTKVGHVITGNVRKDTTNTKSIKATKKKVKIKRGSTYKVKSKLKKMKAGKKLLDGAHGPLRRYITTNKAVATVNSKGTITGISQGWCKVYVQALNGKWSEIEVFVK